MKLHSGFTLLELIISIGILGVLIGLTVANFHSGAQNESVRQAGNMAVSVLRQSQTRTLTGSILENGTVPSGGYGVYFDISTPTILTVFADTNGNFNYTAGEALADEQVKLPAGSSFSLGQSLAVVFSPPDGAVYFNGLASPDTNTVTFQAASSAITRTITIYRLSGQVRVQ